RSRTSWTPWAICSNSGCTSIDAFCGATSTSSSAPKFAQARIAEPTLRGPRVRPSWTRFTQIRYRVPLRQRGQLGRIGVAAGDRDRDAQRIRSISAGQEFDGKAARAHGGERGGAGGLDDEASALHQIALRSKDFLVREQHGAVEQRHADFGVD